MMGHGVERQKFTMGLLAAGPDGPSTHRPSPEDDPLAVEVRGGLLMDHTVRL